MSNKLMNYSDKYMNFIRNVNKNKNDTITKNINFIKKNINSKNIKFLLNKGILLKILHYLENYIPRKSIIIHHNIGCGKTCNSIFVVNFLKNKIIKNM